MWADHRVTTESGVCSDPVSLIGFAEALGVCDVADAGTQSLLICEG